MLLGGIDAMSHIYRHLEGTAKNHGVILFGYDSTRLNDGWKLMQLIFVSVFMYDNLLHNLKNIFIFIISFLIYLFIYHIKKHRPGEKFSKGEMCRAGILRVRQNLCRDK